LIHGENATIGRSSPGQKMPLIYRAMKKEGERPMTGRTATSLGVRIPGDIAVDETGSNNLHCWKMGDGEFVDGSLTSALNFRRDSAIHGLVEPNAIVPLETYEADLTATREHWKIDEV
jgi:hypothetical protein